DCKRRVPVMRAIGVSSLTRPRLRHGLWGVPRWRTRIVPACTSCPEKRLTPSRCPWESRPLVEEPPPFLCAMEIFLSRRGEPDEGLYRDVADLHGSIVLPVAANNLVLFRSEEHTSELQSR